MGGPEQVESGQGLRSNSRKEPEPWGSEDSHIKAFWGGNVGALIIGIWFWGKLHYTYNEEPQNSIGNYLGSYTTI